MIKLSPRLECAAGYVIKNKSTADIGTDHAYLPAYLALNGITEKIIACDIGVLPLKNAEKTLKTYSLENKIELRISDGLKSIKPGEVQQIIICGMGGTLMREILTDAPWIRNNGINLILQPMTHSEDVREFLCENGFSVTDESFVTDGGHVYCCISAEYDGNVCTCEPGYYYFGDSFNSGNFAADEYIGRQFCRIKKKFDGLTSSGINNEITDKLRSIIEYYEKRTKK